MQQEQNKKTFFGHIHFILFELKLSLRLTLVIQFVLILFFAITSFAVGIYLFYLTPNTSYTAYDYGGSNDCISKLGKNSLCTASIIVEKRLLPPVHIYYELDNFISNSKDYISSKSSPQLYGKQIDPNTKEGKKCMPYMTNKQMGVNKSWTGKDLDPNALASPCGLQAKLFFRDQFQFWRSDSKIPIQPAVSKRQFQRGPRSEDTQWIDPSQSRFQIWMTSSINKTVSKLYGVINQVMEPGNYMVKINNMMNYSVFQTKKNIRLTKINNEFGNNKLLAALFIAGGLGLLAICTVRFIYDLFQIKKKS